MNSADSSPPLRPERQTVIPILGMHRSGTSMVTRLLNVLGLELGEPLLDAGPDNPEGYWENASLVRINAEILQSLDRNIHGFGSYQEIVSTPGLAQRITVTGNKSLELRTLLSDTFHSHIWGWKDPRTVLTWPVWKVLLTQFGYTDVRPLIIVRRPGEVVRSLASRKSLTPEWQDIPDEMLYRAGLDVWKGYAAIVSLIARNTGCLVTDDSSYSDPESAREELARVAEYCGLSRDDLGGALVTIRPRTRNDDVSRFEDADSIRLYDELVDRVRTQRVSGETPRPSLTVSGTTPKPLPPVDRVLQEAARLKQAGEIPKSIALLRGYVAKAPDSQPGRCALAFSLMETGHLAEALDIADSLIADDATFAEGYNLRGFGLCEQGLIEAGLEAFERAAQLSPTSNPLLSNILFASLYADHLSPQEITDLHARHSSAIERNALGSDTVPSAPSPRSEDGGRLRIGFLSADLRQHPVGYFLRSILQHRDELQFECLCYHTVPAGDSLTSTLQSLADGWRDCGIDSDETIAGRIAADEVDILIDLSGHTAANRAGVLARRPAPVQALYLGYPGTSGMSSLDHVISDHMVSPAEYDGLYTENVARLPGCFLCFHPHESAPEPSVPAFEQNGVITFGSFNHLSKISSTTIRLWARVLSTVPGSRLVLKALALTDPGTRQLFVDRFEAAGVAADRIELLPPTVPLEAFLAEYRRIDISLDPVPYNGGTTTCEALWMGVPVISLPGDSFCARMGLSILNTVGLEDFVAESADHYVDLARRLAADRPRLAKLRRNLRSRVAGSPLCDGRAFTRDFQSVLLDLHQQRCSGT